MLGDDIEHVPVFLSFLLIEEEGATLFLQPEALTEEVAGYLKECCVSNKWYSQVYDAAGELPRDARLLMDCAIVNYRFASGLPKTVTVIGEETASEL